MSGGGWSAVSAWVRIDLRNRARSLVVLGLLVAVTTGVVLTATAGARRGGTAVDRLLERTRPATVAVLPNEAGFDWDAVAALPGVEAIGQFPLTPFVIDGVPPDLGAGFVYIDPAVMRDIERPVVLEGRLADPSRDDEAVITPAFEDTFDKGVGDRVTITLNSPEQVDEYYLSFQETEPEGPTIETTIVGVVRAPWFSDTGPDRQGLLTPSSGLFQAHPDSFLGAQETAHVNAIVRLEGGADAVPAFRQQLAEVSGRRDIDFFYLAAEAQHVAEVADFEASSLLVFALSAFIAALFLVGQSVVRYVSASTRDLQVLLSIGMPPRHVRAAAAVGPTLAAIIGTVVGVGIAVAGSSRFPIGTAAPLEPSPGGHVDLTVLAAGLVLIPLLIAGGAVQASRPASRSLAIDSGGRRSLVANLTARTGAPVPLSVGASFALDRGRGAQSVPVYPAIVGSIVGVLGVVAALTFAAGVEDASDHPERFGQVAGLQMFLGFNNEEFLPSAEVLPLLADDPDVVAVNDTRQGVVESGPVPIAAFALDPVDEPTPVVVIEGRLPAATDEVTLAPRSARDVGAKVGDSVELVGSRSTGSYVVSGIAFVPEGAHNAYDSGAWMGSDTYDELIEGFKFRTADVVLRDGTDPSAIRARLADGLADAMGATPEEALGMLEPLAPPSRLAELEQLQRLPLFLAGFLALLAVAAVGHALATAVRRRRHDLAVLRAVGVTRWQSVAAVLVQAAVLALVGLALGIPLGFALGRVLWRSVADTTPIEYVPPFAVGALILIAPIALLAAAILAAWPSQRAASLRVAHVLRTE
ncbi:MAG: FtsX-like permease family protein [Acidimicrobiales bacterium]